jgi:hypothetical protein
LEEKRTKDKKIWRQTEKSKLTASLPHLSSFGVFVAIDHPAFSILMIINFGSL